MTIVISIIIIIGQIINIISFLGSEGEKSRTHVSPSPLAGPQPLLGGPQTPLACPKTPTAGPQTPPA